MSGLNVDEPKVSSMLTLCVELNERKYEIRCVKLCSSKLTITSLTRSDLSVVSKGTREHFPVVPPERLVFNTGR